MADRESSIQIAESFMQPWEGLSSKDSTGKDHYFLLPNNVSATDTIYAYLDSGGVPTIGWGTTVYNATNPGVSVQLGDKITRAVADQEYDYEVRQKENYLNNYADISSFTDTQYAALISLAYNAGQGNAEKMIDYIFSGPDAATLDTYWQGFHIHDSAGNLDKGLVNRRKDETMLYDGNYNAAYSFYLRNQATIDNTIWIVAAVSILVGIGAYIYYSRKK